MRFFESIANLPECNGICLLLESEVTRQWRALGEQKSVEIAPLFFRKFDGAGSALGPFRVSESVDTTAKSMRLSVVQSTKSSVRMVKHCRNGARTEYRTGDSRVPDALDDPRIRCRVCRLLRAWADGLLEQIGDEACDPLGSDGRMGAVGLFRARLGDLCFRLVYCLAR
jgi:hypothetical protein